MRLKKNDFPIKDVIKAFMSSNNKTKEGLEQKRIQAFWKERFGKTISSYTDRVVYRQQTLFIYLKSSSLKQELLMGREKIMEAYKKALPDIVIKEIKIK